MHCVPSSEYHWAFVYVVLLGAPRRNEIILSLLDQCSGHIWCLEDHRTTNTQAGSFVAPLLEYSLKKCTSSQ